MKRIRRHVATVVAIIVPAFVMPTATAAGADRVPLLAQAAPPPATPQAPPTPQQRVAVLKQWLQASQAQLRTYQWIETTVVAKGGEEKARKQNNCYYGVDGNLQKVPIAGSEEEKAGGPPGILPPGKLLKLAGKKKAEESKEYMEQAGAMIHQYVPPDPNRIQQAVSGGNFSVSPAGPRVRLTFRNYLKQNDALNVDVEVPTNRLLGMSVSSYLEDAKDAIQLDVTMGVLPDGTIFAQRTVLAAPAKDVTVTTENTGHRRAGG